MAVNIEMDGVYVGDVLYAAVGNTDDGKFVAVIVYDANIRSWSVFENRADGLQWAEKMLGKVGITNTTIKPVVAEETFEQFHSRPQPAPKDCKPLKDGKKTIGHVFKYNGKHVLQVVDENAVHLINLPQKPKPFRNNYDKKTGRK